MKQTVDIVEEIVNGIDLTVEIQSITDNTDGTYLLEICNTSYLQKGFTVTIDSVSYEITILIKDVSITVSGSVLPTATSFTAYPLHYTHGTLVQTNEELAKIKTASNKTPLIFVHETIEDDFHGVISSLDRTSSIRLFFLTQSNWSKFSTDEHYQEALNQMQELVVMFIAELNASRRVKQIEAYKVKNHTKFANYLQGSYDKAFFDKNMTGCELNITIDFLKIDDCIEC